MRRTTDDTTTTRKTTTEETTTTGERLGPGAGARAWTRPLERRLSYMPEGDSIHRAARRLQALVGERVEVEAPHPRAAALNIAGRLDGRRLEGVEAIGKNLLLHFEGGVTLRSHLRMQGRWRVRPRGQVTRGAPWLDLRSPEHEASQWNGPVLELGGDAVMRLGPDILETATGSRVHDRCDFARLPICRSRRRFNGSSSWPGSGTCG